MSRKHKVAVVVGVVVVLLLGLASCGGPDRRPRVIRAEDAKETRIGWGSPRDLTEAEEQEILQETREALRKAQHAAADQRAGLDQPAHEGHVVSVDDGADAVVISLGSVDGVKPGFRYTVSRGNQWVAMVEIAGVQAKVSTGRSIKNLQKMDIQIGDRVMSR
jgi:hypothetical protein